MAVDDGPGPAMGAGCLVLFSLPFMAGGVATLLAGAGFFGRGVTVHSQGGALAVGAAFLLAGVGLAVAAVSGARRLTRENELVALFPDQPWRWRADWAADTAREPGERNTDGALLAAVLWNLISWTGVFLMVPDALDEGETLGAVLLLGFAAIGVGLLVRAVLMAMRHARYGSATLHCERFPLRPGGELVGLVAVEGHADGPVTARLVCQKLVTSGSGDNRTTVTTELGSTSAGITATYFRSDPPSTRIPIHMPVAAGLPDTRPRKDDMEIRWVLQVRADVPGPDLKAEMEVPVYAEVAPTAADDPAPA